LTFDLLTLKVVSQSRVTWPTSVPILVFLGLSVLDLGLMYTRQTDADVRQVSDAYHRLMPTTLWAGHNKIRRQLVCPGSAPCSAGRSDGNSATERHTHLLSKIENESDAAGNLNCGNSARKWRSTSKLLPCHARHCCSL